MGIQHQPVPTFAEPVALAAGGIPGLRGSAARASSMLLFCPAASPDCVLLGDSGLPGPSPEDKYFTGAWDMPRNLLGGFWG